MRGEEDNLSRASVVYLLRAISFSSEPRTRLAVSPWEA